MLVKTGSPAKAAADDAAIKESLGAEHLLRKRRGDPVLIYAPACIEWEGCAPGSGLTFRIAFRKGKGNERRTA